MSHTGSDGSSSSTRIRRAGFQWSSTAENVAHNQKSIDEVFKAWKTSPGHFQNMVNPQLTMMGFARDGDYWTMDIADPSSSYGERCNQLDAQVDTGSSSYLASPPSTPHPMLKKDSTAPPHSSNKDDLKPEDFDKMNIQDLFETLTNKFQGDSEAIGYLNQIKDKYNNNNDNNNDTSEDDSKSDDENSDDADVIDNSNNATSGNEILKADNRSYEGRSAKLDSFGTSMFDIPSLALFSSLLIAFASVL